MRFLPLLLVVSLSASAVACSAPVDETSQSDSAVTAPAACLPTLACAAPPTPVTASHRWRHWVETPSLVTTDPISGLPSPPNHRGRDLFVNPGAPQTIIAQFVYGITDTDLDDEDVDVYVQRDCESGWEMLGTATTTSGGHPHAAVEGVSDHGGRVFFEIPAARRLGPGRHRVRLVVQGDKSSTDLFIDVVPPKTPIFISDVDGTLTSSENVEWAAMLVGATPGTHDDAPEALRALAAKGYRPMYVTARPEWLVQRTREFLDAHGFPPGIIHTSTSALGAGTGAGAAKYKTDELRMLADKGLIPTFGFGNRSTDSEAYATIPQVNNRFFYQITGEYTGRRIETYTELLPELGRLAAACRQ